MVGTNHKRAEHVQRTYFCYVTIKCIIKQLGTGYETIYGGRLGTGNETIYEGRLGMGYETVYEMCEMFDPKARPPG